MHWFWRAVIAAGITYVLDYAVSFAIFMASSRPPGVTPAVYLNAMLIRSVLLMPVYLPVAALPIPIYLALTRRYCSPQNPGETFCRKCGYILRGISEPRCPECGERI